jgi:hypothetical protein
VKSQIVARRGFETIHLLDEMVAEFEYQKPTYPRGTLKNIDPKRCTLLSRGKCVCS